MLKLAYFLRNLETSRENNSRILGIKDAKFLGYCFYMKAHIQGDFQICISVPLSFNIFHTFFPVDTGRELNVHKTFRRRRGRLVNVLCTFSLCPLSKGF